MTPHKSSERLLRNANAVEFVYVDQKRYERAVDHHHTTKWLSHPRPGILMRQRLQVFLYALAITMLFAIAGMCMFSATWGTP